MRTIYIVPLFLLSTFLIAQEPLVSDSLNQGQEEYIEKVKRFSLGAKLGIPNLAGGSIEVVLPLFQNRLAPYFDYSQFSVNLDSSESSLSYSELGANIYFNDKGKGFFVGLGSARMNADVLFTDLVFSEDGVTTSGSGSTDLNLNTFNVKLGIKSGGTFFFRFEVGYGLGSIPDQLTFTATSQGITEQFTEDIPAIPGIGTNGLLIGNIGFGLSF